MFDIKFKKIKEKHLLCQDIDLNPEYYPKVKNKYGLEIANFLKKCYCDADETLIAFHNKKPIGFFRYSFKRGLRSESRIKSYIYASGTYVIPEYRNKNIGKILWLMVVSEYKIKEIYVTTITKMGFNFIKSMKNTLGKHVNIDSEQW